MFSYFEYIQLPRPYIPPYLHPDSSHLHLLARPHCLALCCYRQSISRLSLPPWSSAATGFIQYTHTQTCTHACGTWMASALKFVPKREEAAACSLALKAWQVLLLSWGLQIIYPHGFSGRHLQRVPFLPKSHLATKGNVCMSSQVDCYCHPVHMHIQCGEVLCHGATDKTVQILRTQKYMNWKESRFRMRTVPNCSKTTVTIQ